MARECWGVLRLQCAVVAATTLHVGGGGDSEDADLILARDGLGRPYISGRSLFGALRRWWEGRPKPGEEAAVQELRTWLGYVDGEEGAASWVTIDDALLCADREELAACRDDAIGFRSALESRIDVRDGVGIDRATGAAAHRILNSAEVLPRGTRFWLTLTVAAPTEGALQAGYRYLRALQDALDRGEIRCGRRKTGGQGRLALQDGDAPSLTLELRSHREGVLAKVRASIGAVPGTVVASLPPQWEDAYAREGSGLPSRRRTLQFDVHWRPDEPIMVRWGLDGTMVDTIPFLSRRADGRHEPCIPGTSVKGALRSRAEHRMRSALRLDAPTGGGEQRFLEQLRQLSLINLLFGEAGNDDVSDVGATSKGQGALTIDPIYPASLDHVLDDTMLAMLFRGGVDEAQDKELDRETVRQLARLGYRVVVQNSVDRWTGAAADRRLFSLLRADGVRWSSIELALDLDQLGDQADAGLALVLQLLAELGWGTGERWPLAATIGGSAMRGGGALTVDAAFCRTTGPASGLPIRGVSGHKAPLFASAVDSERLDKAWRAALDAEAAGLRVNA